jgi:hypothetical protein
MNTKQTGVEWLFEQIARRQGSILHTIPFYNENQDLLIQAKEIEKAECNRRIANELKLVGSYFDVSKLDWKEQSHHIRFTSILKDRYLHYKKQIK